jgi:hypothetical protein
MPDGDGVAVKDVGHTLRFIFPEVTLLLNGGHAGVPSAPKAASGNKLGRNDLCSCGSKKKFKVAVARSNNTGGPQQRIYSRCHLRALYTGKLLHICVRFGHKSTST